MIQVKELTFAYPGGQPPVFQDFSWEAAPGETWAILGPSGCGKTTLLYLLAGLRRPAQGRIVVGGQPLERPRPHTGLILQDYGLLPWATVRANAALGLSVRNLYGPDGVHAPRDYRPTSDVSAWLERLGLAAIAGQYPAQISGGQRQRTAIARTLLLKPDLLLMDEPFSSLDAPTREGLQSLVFDLWSEQKLTLVLVTHSIEEAALIGQKILVLSAPPNRKTIVLDNPGAAAGPVFRENPAYAAVCRDLRGLLEPR